MESTKTEFQNKVINRVRQLRMTQNISQPQLAQILMISNGQIGNIESNRYPHKYTIKQLSLISKHFNIPFLSLFKEEVTGQETIDEAINLIIEYDE